MEEVTTNTSIEERDLSTTNPRNLKVSSPYPSGTDRTVARNKHRHRDPETGQFTRAPTVPSTRLALTYDPISSPSSESATLSSVSELTPSTLSRQPTPPLLAPTPPLLITMPTRPPIVYNTGNLATIPLFKGEDDEQYTDDFFKAVDSSFAENNTVPWMLRQIRNKLKGGSVAETWFDSLNQATQKDTWEHFTDAFYAKWPKTVATQLTPHQAAKRVREIRITAEELGQYIEDGKTTRPSHVIWVRKICKEAKRLGAPDHAAGDVRDDLPHPLRGYVSSAVATWAALKTQIEAIDMSELMDKLDERKRTEERLKEQAAAQIEEWMRSITITQRSTAPPITMLPAPAVGYQPNPTMAQPCTQQTSGAGRAPGTQPAFAQTGYRTQSRADRIATLQRNAIPPFPDDAQGHTAYNARCDRWKAEHPGNMSPDETCPFPLKPGTDVPDGTECYTCGKRGHMRIRCTGEPIPEEEKAFRNNVGRLLSPPRTAAPQFAGATPVNVVQIGGQSFGLVPLSMMQPQQEPTGHIEECQGNE